MSQRKQHEPHKSPFSPVEALIADIREGKMIIMTDDEDRENEGDLICAAQLITPRMENFMAKHGRGLVCVPLTEERAQRLGLSAMVQRNREAFSTNFAVTVDAAEGIDTGISSKDRTRTIAVLADSASRPHDLVQPGHIFPLIAKSGGVLRRAGHTEAAVDLANLADLEPVGVICEIRNDEGDMARLPDLVKFAREHDLKIGTIESLIRYRQEREKLVEREQVIKLPTDYGEFELHMYRSKLDGANHLALVKGKIDDGEPVLVRVHSECLTGDVFGSRRCDCGGQLHTALQRIEQEGRGVLLYMRQEGRGIGLAAKIHAYKLQEEGLDTVEANEKLGFGMDLRDYGLGAQILFDLGIRSIRLMTNNPRKVVGLEGHKLHIVEQCPIKLEPNEHNAKYLETKRTKMGHKL
jgi:3,4-dihydroxy 2-butanone 4-phosphate synthase/GTP cyclohydrolase II